MDKEKDSMVPTHLPDDIEEMLKSAHRISEKEINEDLIDEIRKSPDYQLPKKPSGSYRPKSENDYFS